MFNKKVFAQSIAEGVISSLVLFFIPYGTFYSALRPDGLDVSDLQALATVISASLIVVVTLRVSTRLYPTLYMCRVYLSLSGVGVIDNLYSPSHGSKNIIIIIIIMIKNSVEIRTT